MTTDPLTTPAGHVLAVCSLHPKLHVWQSDRYRISMRPRTRNPWVRLVVLDGMRYLAYETLAQALAAIDALEGQVAA